MNSNMINSSNFVSQLKNNGVLVEVSDGKITKVSLSEKFDSTSPRTAINGQLTYVCVPALNMEIYREGDDIKITFKNPVLG